MMPGSKRKHIKPAKWLSKKNRFSHATSYTEDRFIVPLESEGPHNWILRAYAAKRSTTPVGASHAN